MAFTNILKDGERAQRKMLITVAEWGGTWEDGEYTGDSTKELLGYRTEDSSIEFNADIATSTDIHGITYSDVNKTEPQQSFDPLYVMGGSKLAEYLTQAALKNDIAKYNNVFNVYIIAAFITDGGAGATKYYTVRHKNCSIIPTSIGGDAYTNMPIEVHFSNDIDEGSVDKLTKDFVFTKA